VSQSAVKANLTDPQTDPYSIPIEAIDVSNADLYETETWGPYFARLRKEDPVHYCAESDFGAYWSITKFNDIMAVDTTHQIFSSERSIAIGDPDENLDIGAGFITMDPPEHDDVRKVAQPVVGPRNLMLLEPLIRTRVEEILDGLPVGETFNWVDLVSIELTTQMLATLFDFPFEDRRLLTFWSDMATSSPKQTGIAGITEEERKKALLECLDYFTRLWNERVKKGVGERLDLITMLAHGESTKNMSPMDYLGNLMLLIVGGNDTTRNSISGGVLALNEFPSEYNKLRDDLSLIPNMVPEIIRWQTPLPHMRRTVKEDTEFRGKAMKKGDKVVMWYLSGNRDDEVIDKADQFIIDRPKARHHMSFGYGMHRCMGNRLAEMQLRIIWEEIQKRFAKIEVVGEPVRTRSNFVRGFTDMQVQVHRH
jgi:cytochrome P450